MQRRTITSSVIITALAATMFFAPLAQAEEEREGTGLAIPRFVSLKSSEVNVRTGPGTRYPISWIYKREGMPVEIIEESDHWRKIRDYEGAEGWILKSMLSGKRTALIMGKQRALHKQEDEASAPLLRAAPMVIAKLLECTKEWCKLQIDGRKGWMKKPHFYGAYPREEFGD